MVFTESRHCKKQQLKTKKQELKVRETGIIR